MTEEVSFKKRKNRAPAANARQAGAALAAAAAATAPEVEPTPAPAPAPTPAATPAADDTRAEAKAKDKDKEAPSTFYFAKRTVTIEDAPEEGDDDEAELKAQQAADDDAEQWQVPDDADEGSTGGEEASGKPAGASGSKRKLDGGDDEKIESSGGGSASAANDGGAAGAVARGREAIRARLQSKRQKKDNPLAASTRARLKKVDDEVGVASKRTVLPDRSTQDHMIAVEISQAPKLKDGKPKWTGPLKQAENTRAISRFDYQPDLCKDWKDTGYCGFGDSCKFMHDRTDYKSGWQLEKEWKQQEDIKRKRAMGEYVEDEADYRVDVEEALPFACLICREDFVNPVVTKCKHYFCERCALQHYAKDTKCSQCAEQTHGIFNTATKLIAHLKKNKGKPKEKKPAEEDEAPTPGPGHASGRRTTEGWSMP